MSRGGMPMIRCAEYTKFVSEHAFNQVQLRDGTVWNYYDAGPREDKEGEPIDPLVCIHGSSGTAHAFFMQVSQLAQTGYRVISVGYPVVWTHTDWAKSFDRFMDVLNVKSAHLYGVSLGGFFAQLVAKLYPRRVLSLALTNSLCDTSGFYHKSPLYTSAYAYCPEFYLRNMILESFPTQDRYPPGVADAIDFQMAQLDSLSQAQLASRITLNVVAGSSPLISRPGCLKMSDKKITFIDALDSVSISSTLRDQLYGIHPEAKQALIKTGGDFVYLSRYEEVNMHLIVHLRRNGLFIDNKT
mmetsp:Transcript_9620/g.15768  ORF Transcript_9620/g.15768 Transcript_9620/m.15768 type:complete len:299 (-) Transcript_9620:400-1296(-)